MCAKCEGIILLLLLFMVQHVSKTPRWEPTQSMHMGAVVWTAVLDDLGSQLPKQYSTSQQFKAVQVSTAGGRPNDRDSLVHGSSCSVNSVTPSSVCHRSWYLICVCMRVCYVSHLARCMSHMHATAPCTI
jgi:hypothetical protein